MKAYVLATGFSLGIAFAVALVSCGASVVTVPADAAADTGRQHAVFDAWGYQREHDVRDGVAP